MPPDAEPLLPEGSPAEASPPQPSVPESWLRLLEVNKALNSELEPRRLLPLILDKAVELTRAERGFLLLIHTPGEGDQLKLKIEVARTLDREIVRHAAEKVSRSVAAQVIRTGKPLRTADALAEGGLADARSVQQMKLRSILCVPLRVRGQVEGAIYLDHRFRADAFTEDHLTLLEYFGDQAGVALGNARLLAENQERRAEIERLNEELRQRVQVQALALNQARQELARRQQGTGGGLRYGYERIVGRSPVLRKVLETLDRVTDTDCSILILGESGTGKELVARAVHENSPRGKMRFEALNCAAFSESLLESELFGHVRGAFTGAVGDKTGVFEAATGGTVFLDEIGEMGQAMQAKLLRVLESGEIRPVGSNSVRKVNVRILSATHRDLTAYVKSGKFREDLYYRLNTVTVPLPALRERREDIPILVEHFLKLTCERLGRSAPEVPKSVFQDWVSRDWPGNIRELSNEVTRFVLMVSDPDAVPVPAAPAPKVQTNLDERLGQWETEEIQQALKACEGNRTRAAARLGVSRNSLLRRMERLGIQ